MAMHPTKKPSMKTKSCTSASAALKLFCTDTVTVTTAVDTQTMKTLTDMARKIKKSSTKMTPSKQPTTGQMIVVSYLNMASS